ncbi:MAG: polysaccharide biosynthesis/export family protein [Candidatus Omnitrophota bacterium]|jgi:polysaccharide export outer membrane protein
MKEYPTLRLLILFILFFSLACPLFADDKDYRVGPENLLEIDVHYGKDGLISQKVRVSSKNQITFPLIGTVDVTGLTVSELEKKLYTLLEKDYLVNPQVNVVIEEYSTVSVIGEVKKPGSYPIKGRLTVMEAVSLAEGFTKIASPNKTKVIRTNPDGSKNEIPVRLGDIMNGKRQKSNIYLQGGDVIVVSESLF